MSFTFLSLTLKRYDPMKIMYSTVLRSVALGAVAGLVVLSTPASAQTYPSKPIKVIVDGPAGGINDIWTDLISKSIRFHRCNLPGMKK